MISSKSPLGVDSWLLQGVVTYWKLLFHHEYLLYFRILYTYNYIRKLIVNDSFINEQWYLRVRQKYWEGELTKLFNPSLLVLKFTDLLKITTSPLGGEG